MSRRYSLLPAVLLALAGCAATANLSPESPQTTTSLSIEQAFPPGAVRVSSALLARRRSRAPSTEVGDDDAPLLRLPPLERLPRTMWLKGAAYALVQFNPYVGQLGVLAESKRADAGLGFGVVCGYRLTVRGTTAVGLEVSYDASEHTNEISQTGARASRTGLGLRASLHADEKLSPFLAAGVGLYAIDFGDLPPKYDLSGSGVFLGGGADFSPSSRFSMRGELSLGLWEATDELGGGGIAATLTLGLGAVVSF